MGLGFDDDDYDRDHENSSLRLLHTLYLQNKHNPYKKMKCGSTKFAKISADNLKNKLSL